MVCMLGAPTSTRLVHCETVENAFKVQKLRHDFCLYGSTRDVISGHYFAACISARATP